MIFRNYGSRIGFLWTYSRIVFVSFTEKADYSFFFSARHPSVAALMESSGGKVLVFIFLIYKNRVILFLNDEIRLKG